MSRRRLFAFASTLALVAVPNAAMSAAPSPEQALRLKPLQADVDYETPTGADVEKCTVEAKSGRDGAGWIVKNPAGQLLRQFLDTNSDRAIDQWSYYKDGIEVYRDVDSNFNKKADQYRWLGTEGIRWGLDDNEDGKIDRWKMISPEEVTFEVVAALRTQDAARFSRLLLSADELATLGLNPEQKRELEKKIAAANDGFARLAQQQTTVGPKSQWLNFGASQPGVVPAGTDGTTKDIIAYENVAAIIDTEGQHGQIIVGTMVRSGDAWRLIDLPRGLLPGQSNDLAGGYFFRAALPQSPNVAAMTNEGLSQRSQELIRDLEQIDKSLERAGNPTELAQLHSRRADILEALMKASATDEERDTWIRQYADTISAAAQSNGYPGGVQRLERLLNTLASDPRGKKHEAYVKFRYLTAEYGQSLQQPEPDFAKIQERWLESLEQFVRDYPSGEDTPDAMLQLAIGKEFAGEADAAVALYSRIASTFPDTETAKKAAGAKRRLESVGQSIELRGTSLENQPVSLASYRGQMVLIHYWATWCEPCKQDMEILKKMQSKYARQGFTLIGVNLDSQRDQAVAFLQSKPLPWAQLYEPGGLDSRLANEMGILTLPTMLLVDKQGKVLNRNIHAAELDEELGKRLR